MWLLNSQEEAVLLFHDVQLKDLKGRRCMNTTACLVDKPPAIEVGVGIRCLFLGTEQGMN